MWHSKNQSDELYSTIIALAYNNNVTSGDKVRLYYITMYQSKRNHNGKFAYEEMHEYER